jgi:hypothetical protein
VWPRIDHVIVWPHNSVIAATNRKQKMTHYSIITKADGSFGVQRKGGTEVHGSFATYGEACEAIGLSNIADAAALADKEQY